jgi:Protein of unknown function (DUF1761)
MGSDSLVLPTIASLVVGQFVGFLWYGPLFGKTWLRAMKNANPKFHPEPDDFAPIAAAGVTWLLASVMYSCLVSMTGYTAVTDLVKLALVAWVGFSFPAHAFAVIFEKKNKTVAVIGAAYLLAVYFLMAMCHVLL